MSLNPDHEIPEDLLELERQLQGLAPSDISEELFFRLESSMTEAGADGASAVESFEKLEVHLQQMSPSTMPGNMIDRMVSAMDNWHESLSVEEKLVSFVGKNNGAGSTRKRYSFRMLSAVAAVAFLGVFTALTMTGFFGDKPAGNSTATTQAGNSQVKDSSLAYSGSPYLPPSSQGSLLMRDSLTHKVTNTSDQGVVLAGQSIPHRCIKVEYVDRVKVRASDGSEIMINRPGVEYVLIPVKTY